MPLWSILLHAVKPCQELKIYLFYPFLLKQSFRSGVPRCADPIPLLSKNAWDMLKQEHSSGGHCNRLTWEFRRHASVEHLAPCSEALSGTEDIPVLSFPPQTVLSLRCSKMR